MHYDVSNVWFIRRKPLRICVVTVLTIGVAFDVVTLIATQTLCPDCSGYHYT